MNFAHDSNNYFLSKKVNLGLDLQGGSYLLLEIDSEPIVKQKLQAKLITLRKFLKEGCVFTDDQIDSYISLKFEEIHNFEHTPHPIEFDMYYSC